MRDPIDRLPRQARTCVAAALAALAGLASAVEAQAPGGDAAQEDTVEVEDLVVTAHRVPVARDAVTATVTVIDREEIESSGADHVLELLHGVPGANVAQSGSFGDQASLFLRGGESDFVKVLVDGVPVNRPGGGIDLSALTLDNVERIEIVRGPASVVHGSDAVAGVVQIFTRSGEGPARASASARAGTFGTLDWETALSGGSEEARYAVSLSRFVTDGPLAFNDDHRQTVASGRFAWAPSDRTEASMSVRLTDRDTHFPTDGSGNVVDENSVRRGERVVLSTEVSHLVTDRLEAVVQLGLDEDDERVADRPDGPADTTGTFASRREADVGRRRAGARLNYRAGDHTVVTVGVEGEFEDQRSRSTSTSSFGVFEDSVDVDRDNVGYFVQAVTELGPWSLNAGGRLDDNEAFGTFETGRVGVAYTLPTRTRLRVNVGNAFKEPTFTENFGTSTTVGNPDLDPERSRTWEVGARQPLWGDRVSLGVTFFDQAYEDLVQFTSSPADSLTGGTGGTGPAPNFFNVAEATSRGLELEVEADLPHGLRVRGDYTWLDTEVTDAGFQGGPGETFESGEELLRRPAHSANAAVTWRPPTGGSARVSVRRVGERDDILFSGFTGERVTLDAYTRVDVALRHPIRLPGAGSDAVVTPTLRVDNLFDEDYREVAGFDTRGRTVLAGLEATLGL
jgi:vitamin B12 transporter